ncbi:autotransporter outer membrane beta-barrel domain-containing protein [Bartonella sp. C271]|uniref:autotransporter family protein n=1 Tax=Bartonella sp. C271 TaxID=3070220 RepID=UPI0038B5227A
MFCQTHVSYGNKTDAANYYKILNVISGTSHQSFSIDGNNIMTVVEKGTIKPTDYSTAVLLKGEGNRFKLGDVRIESEYTALSTIKADNIIIMEKGSILNQHGASAQASGINSIIELGNVEINSGVTGLYTGNNATITMKKGLITTDGFAVQAAGYNSMIKLGDIQISGKSGGISADKNSIVTMEKGSIKGETGVYIENGSMIEVNNVQIEAKRRGVSIVNGGTFIMNKGFIKAKGEGVEIFQYLKSETDKKLAGIFQKRAEIKLTDVCIESETAGIIASSYSSLINFNLKNSEIRSNVLIEKKYPLRNFTLNADHSILEGGALINVQEGTRIVFNLSNGTVWTPKISKKEITHQETTSIHTYSYSSVSMLNLDNSTIVFDKPTDDQYQVLHVGPLIINADFSAINNPEIIYNAKGGAKIYFNTDWSSELPTKEQKTDRLVINGGVSGTTTVYVNDIKGKTQTTENTSIPANKRGVSLIQVAGEANKDSFKLANGYTTINNSPYKYTLNAYGPEASSRDANQNMFNPSQSYWDFRLQNAYLDSQSKVKALVPQMASYLVMPNALFSAGFSDMNQQNASLRTMSLANENNKKNAFFLSSYGNTATLSSNHTALEYGYGADLRYNALQIGVALGALENQNTTTNFGLLGTYGQVSFTPKDMEGADKSTLDKWSISAFGSIQHRNGLYLDTLLSYGLVKGHIKVANIGNVAKLSDANTLSASATIGQQFSTGVEGLVFEPQAQLAYQRLMFDSISDNDNLEIDMNNPNQWLVRIGGRLTKTVTAAENGYAVSLYGKLNMIKAFGDSETIQVSGYDFHLDPMGSSVEGGVGINAQLNKKIELHGDISHQHKLQKAGISATSFLGGVRYRF